MRELAADAGDGQAQDRSEPALACASTLANCLLECARPRPPQVLLVAPLARALGLSGTLLFAYVITAIAARGASSVLIPAAVLRSFALSASYMIEASAAALLYALSPRFEPVMLCLLHAATIIAPSLLAQ